MGKRDFYVDDELIITKPGINTEISSELKEQEGSHGNVSFIQGMSIRTTPILENYANQVRLFLHDKFSLYSAELGTQKSAIVNEYRSIANQVQLTVKEPVLPNLIYILTATLSGSILVSRRALPLRFITPVIFGGAATSYFMPNTFETISQKIQSYEKDVAPEVYQAQNDFISKIGEVRKEAEKGSDNLQGQLTETVHDVRVSLIKLINGK